MTKINFFPLLLILSAVIFYAGCTDRSVKPVKGELFAEDIDGGKRYSLDGEWEFYWEKLYAGDDFNKPEAEADRRYINYNVNWNKADINGWNVPDTGYATYRLKIKLPDKMNKRVLMHIPYYSMAVNIFCNNRLIFSNGTVGTTEGTSETVSYHPFIAEAVPDKGIIDLVIHASNFQYPRGGIRDSIIMGERDSIIRFIEISTSFEMILLGSLIMMSLYNLILFFLLKRYKFTFYFSLVCFFTSIHMMVNGTLFLGKFGISWSCIEKIHDITWMAIVYFFLRYYMALFEKYYNKIILLVYTVSTSVICIIIAVAPVFIFDHLHNLILVMYFFAVFYSLGTSIIELKNRKANSIYFVLSFCIIIIFMVIDTFPSIIITRYKGLAPAGIFLFSIIQSILIGKEINIQFSVNTELSNNLLQRNNELAQLNNNLSMMVEEKTENLRIQNTIMNANNKILLNNKTDLEKRISDAEHSLLRKNDLVIINSRHASMGEMIGFLGHQWKQSIYAISLYSEALKNILQQKGTLDIETARDPLEKIDSFIIEMYTTMNDLSDFMKPKKDVEYFSITDVVEETIRLMNDFITINSVEIIKDYMGDVSLTGFSNEMKQVVMNIIKNAIDVFSERSVKERVIVISVSSDNQEHILKISDNAGGIPLDNPDEVFDRFYTSKTDGTGLGLYLCRMIIEQRFGGNIEVHNTEGGASFVISIPVFTEDTVL